MNAVRAWFDRFAAWVTGAKHAGYSLSALRILYGVAIVSFLFTSLADRHYLNGTFQYGEPRTVIGSVGMRF